MQSANIPQGPLNPNGYSEAEVLRELRALDGTRYVDYRYELLDGDLNFKRDMDEVLSGSIQFSYVSEIKRTATFTVRGGEDIDYLHDHIRPFFRLKMPPSWSSPHKTTGMSWSNSWDGASGGELVNSATSSYTGDPVASVSRPSSTVFDKTHRIKSSASVRTGASNTATNHNILTNNFVFTGEGTALVRGWFWKDADTGSTVQLTLPGIAQVGFSINHEQDASVWFYGATGISVPGAAAQLANKWVRYEIEVDWDSGDVQSRFYYTDPLTLTEDNAPDFERTTNFPLIPTFVHPTASYLIMAQWLGGVADKYVWWGPTEVGDTVVHDPVPVPSDDDYVEWCLGTFLMASPTRSVDENDVVTREIEAFDRSQLFIDDKRTTRLTVPKGYSYYQLLKDFLQDYPHYIEPTTWVVGRTREFDVGVSLKEAVDRVADSINYHSLRVDEWGTVVVDNYIEPGNRTPEFHYTDDEISIMSPDVEVEFDITNIPNVWIVSLNEADEDPVHVTLENHDPANPFSIPRRGRKIVDYREQEEGFDRASIMRKAKRIQFEANRVFENIEFTTLNNPLHSANDCYTMDYGVLNVNNKYTEISWEMDLKEGSLMSHTCRRNVDLDPELFDGFVDGHLQVNGAATFSNIKWGQVSFTSGLVANKPISVNVTGMNLGGSGMVHVFLTAVTTVPGSGTGTSRVAAAGVKDRTPNGFKLWHYRTTAFETVYNWMAVRSI